jgi:hypothetical protein
LPNLHHCSYCKYKTDFEKNLTSSKFRASFVAVLGIAATFVCDFLPIPRIQNNARSFSCLPSFRHFKKRRNLRIFPTYLPHLCILIHLSYPEGNCGERPHFIHMWSRTGIYWFFENVGATLKLCLSERWHGASSILRTHNCWAPPSRGLAGIWALLKQDCLISSSVCQDPRFVK